MCRMQFALALAALFVGLVHSWDIVMSTGNRLDFYTDYSITHTIEDVQHTFSITALTYDAVHNTLLFVDKQSDNASIFSFNISTNKFEHLVTRKNIEDIAFDPVTGLLFWTDTVERSIYSISLKSGSKNNVYGNLLIMDDEIPMAIAVDSCRGYIYWTNINTTNPTIERARFKGSERQVVIDNFTLKPVSLTIDQQTRRIIWAEVDEGKQYNIQSTDLNGKNKTKLCNGSYTPPKVITVSKDRVYIAAESIYYLEKNSRSVHMYTTPMKLPSGIAANYKIEEQTQGINECASLMSLLQINSAINDSLNIPTDVGLSCVHGTKVNGDSLCICTPGYTGERCNVSVCQNYCLQGNCTVSTEGQPQCSCGTGYSGERCEVNVCFNYCLNNGVCFLHEELYKPVCQCTGSYEGSRCDAIKDVTFDATLKLDSVEKKVTLGDLVSNWRKTQIFCKS